MYQLEQRINNQILGVKWLSDEKRQRVEISFIERLAIIYHDSGFLDDITIQLFLFLLGLKDEATRF